jgi:CTP:molybdopterin cytidylyltransferase MocA
MAPVIPALVLAAGLSTRMGGRPKALLPIGASGETFVTRVVRTLLRAGIDDVVVVAGHDADRVARHVGASGLAARVVVNEAYASGQFSSLLAGLAVVDRPGVAAMLVTLVDVPAVRSETVRAVVARYRDAHAPIVRPTSGAKHGHPVLIDRSLFDAIRCADEREGLKPIVRAHATPLGDVAIEDEGAYTDVDTPAEYDALVRSGGAIVDPES